MSWMYSIKSNSFLVKTAVKFRLNKILNTDANKIFLISLKVMHISFRYR